MSDQKKEQQSQQRTEQSPQRSGVAPFGIEADHPRCSDLLIQCIPNCRLRSKLSHKGGGVSPGMAHTLGVLPVIPGMQLHVNPGNLSYTIFDPLTENESLCDLIQQRLKQTGASYNFGGTKLRGIPTLKGSLDVHYMKTLCRELIGIVGAGEAVVCKGALPSVEDVKTMPGEFLLNPGSRIISSTQPRYEKDWEDWVARLATAGV